MKQPRYHIIIASFVFAILVWISINMADEYALVKHIPVVVENMREGKALRFPIPKTISANFRGRGWQLATIYFSTDLKYYIDVSMLGSEVYRITSHDFFEHVKLPMAVQPLDVKPETLVLALAEYKEKRVPVIPRLVLNYHEGFGQVGSLHVTPESVVVGGAANLSEAVLRWYTEYRKYDNLRSPVNEDLELEEPPTFSLEVVPHSVHVQVDVRPFAERTISELQ